MNILLVDDHQATRAEIRALIEREPGMVVVAEAGTGEEAVQKASSEIPDVIVMDILLPGMNGIEAIQAIRARDPSARIVALSNHHGKGLIRAVFDAGSLGYVRKNRAFEELVPALRAVAGGGRYVSQQATDSH